MVLDQECNDFALARGNLQPLHLAGCNSNRFSCVVAARPRAFADIVQQQCEPQKLRLRGFVQKTLQTPVVWLGAARKIADGLKCDEGMFVHRVAMVEIALDQAVDATPRRESYFQ